ncbi:uncharacterized protein N7515_000419 [Penicillium bovifimosum]|uniref:Uncharacterized protein n=1 Tax=Penicillium bovifimosum TaxID=126998 RepID=A0A9W9LBF1_9EURO|nr:uncharacterized protein N7515_000419 [Penicillium bovifimosum]KAJ5145855.1 hypothetical protein N7515_000419 [Penicillium bovifimosum]
MLGIKYFKRPTVSPTLSNNQQSTTPTISKGDLEVKTNELQWGSWKDYDCVKTAGLGERSDENSVIALYNKHGFLVGNVNACNPMGQACQTLMIELWRRYDALKAQLFNNKPVEGIFVTLFKLDPNFLLLYEHNRIERRIYASQTIGYQCRTVLDKGDTQRAIFELSYRPDKRRCVPVFYTASRA